MRRQKAALPNRYEAQPAFASAGGTRSSHGGNEMAEAFEWRSQLVSVRVCRPQRE